ncbi:NLR family CARD domain-containing protein 4 [Hemicordylus capensis]|uniref:NLR family CARD domain-containing protein 4 n=1 Tax=Hemicordylus capensis TaxID=884348 RepID=UPI0023025C5A|nr:NLR family CARD domain-containing protein 4 [Hemicordylus capensis]XP_053159591.1 NLR family CARD domain-containing protein 4 [Hemicordylus capensis]XP_053159597.1 NLR family CARD domain-containing protein 4 [Hemicordylus capensis]XP_053159607.1 NLR family CARD domain-containing protein 4 [Hemicordylus capensis]XP_053159616.1 NLR family CARD domain-containing protein 4 [Hemicordylus capensis]XP_053159626.1 NLR family CARD domain-containing protein 4 [Hemicordylus capensis]XP_053159631.1 NL
MEFIQKNSVQLIQRMGMPIIKQIVDDLFAEFVLSEEEAEIICQRTRQDASRSLIYSILKKGERTCDLLVKSLEKRDPFLFQNLQEYCAAGEMTQENIDCLAKDLKDFYKYPSFKKFHPLGKEIDIIFDLTESYTDILLWKKNTHNIRQGQLSLNDLLNELENPCIIEGEAGKGKTTLLKRIALLWANEAHLLMKFKLVFFISLSVAQAGLYETICGQLLTEPYTICKQDFMKMLKSLREKVLFLLDGYDEFRSQNCPEIELLIKENHQFKNTVILTTRTESISRVRHIGSLIAETGDLSTESATKLVRNVLKPKLAEGLLSQLEKPDSTFQQSGSATENLMKTPLFVVIACAIQMGEATFNPHTQTTLFCTLYDLLVEKNKHKTRETSEEHFCLSISHCGDLALDGVFDHKFDFQVEDFSNVKEEVLLATGLVNKYTAQRLNPIYRFFHKSFQEYTAGRRLSSLLASHRDKEMVRGHSYLQKMDNISDIITTYHNLLLYTCGSSAEATRKVIKHMSAIYQQGCLFGLPSLCDLTPEMKAMKKEANTQEEEGLSAVLGNSFVECAISFLYESFSDSTVSEEFEEFFHGKGLYINTQSIPTYICGFFEHFSNCVSTLEFIKLDFFGSSSLGDVECSNSNPNPWKTVIPEKAVSLFFNWDRKLNSLEITLKDFNKLEKGDVKYLEKICCSASGLRLHINKSPGVTGKLRDVLKTCSINMQDLTVESTPLTTEDEQQIAEMVVLKTIKIKDLQNESLGGVLLDRIPDLVNVEKLTLDNIKMNEDSTKKLAKGLKDLKRLHSLQLSHLMDIGDGMTHIVESISTCLGDLEEIHLVNCCLSGTAVKILAQNLCSFHKLYALDLSDNFLGDGGKEALHRLVGSLTVLPNMKVLMLPWDDEANLCLVRLLEQLERMPQLTKFGLRKWGITDSEAIILGTFFEKTSLRDIQYLDLAENCMTSNGWLTILKVLPNLNQLTFLDFSCKQGFLPSSHLVLSMSRMITQLDLLQEIKLTGWQFDAQDLRVINKAKKHQGNKLQVKIS